MAHGEVDEGHGSKKLGLAAPNINVTPLIDVLLVLLIIFMVIQPQKEAKFETAIPQKPDKAEDHPVEPNNTLLVVRVLREGNGPTQEVAINKEAPINISELSDRLRGLLAGRPDDKTVFIVAPTDKLYADVVQVIDAAKEAGAEPIGLQVDNNDELFKAQ